MFSIGLQGIDAADSSKVEEIIFQTLEHVAQNGFPQERIEAVLHNLELSLRHVRNLSRTTQFSEGWK